MPYELDNSKNAMYVLQKVSKRNNFSSPNFDFIGALYFKEKKKKEMGKTRK